MTDVIIKIHPGQPIAMETILKSDILKTILTEYVAGLKDTDPVLKELLVSSFGEKTCVKGLLSFLTRLTKEEYADIREEYMPLTQEKGTILDMFDRIYDIWRRKERYAEANRDEDTFPSSAFISQADAFSEAVISFYRRVYENVLGGEQTVYRQLPSGINAGFILNDTDGMILPKDLEFLNKTREVEAVMIRPPFICSTKENTRTGTFFEKEVKLEEKDYNPSDYRAVCLLIKGRVGYVFVRKDYLSFLVALGNLFKIVRFEDVKEIKPDFIIVFGAQVKEELTYYYKDEDTYIGLCPALGHIGYFGYMKKIILTLHNLTMIDQKKLPIHGAGMEISLKNGKSYNIVILGDSGAGKSETIEAVRTIGANEVNEIKTIYDDMGTFMLRDGQVMTCGTEIGAFVRLDDLDKGYSLKSVDRAIYMNIESVNSRVVIPIETYEFSKDLHKVDVFLVADNYTPDERGLIAYSNLEEAEAEFIKGQRMAKGTTSEKGLVTSFFANPFGPVQRETECRPLIHMYMERLYQEGAYVGRLFTKLALDPTKGPENGAKAILELLKKLG